MGAANWHLRGQLKWGAGRYETQAPQRSSRSTRTSGNDGAVAAGGDAARAAGAALGGAKGSTASGAASEACLRRPGPARG